MANSTVNFGSLISAVEGILSFKLDNGEPVVFNASVVKLVQRINLINQDFEYGLTVQ